jgi:hypothetical protein
LKKKEQTNKRTTSSKNECDWSSVIFEELFIKKRERERSEECECTMPRTQTTAAAAAAVLLLSILFFLLLQLLSGIYSSELAVISNAITREVLPLFALSLYTLAATTDNAIVSTTWKNEKNHLRGKPRSAVSLYYQYYLRASSACSFKRV